VQITFQRAARASMRSVLSVSDQTRLEHSNAFECAMVQPSAANCRLNLVELAKGGICVVIAGGYRLIDRIVMAVHIYPAQRVVANVSVEV
jgi:hypothetical protein